MPNFGGWDHRQSWATSAKHDAFSSRQKGALTMQPRRTLLCTAAVAALIAATPAAANTLKSGVAFNNGIGKKTATQPAAGVEVARVKR
jgi:hypothetical protein